MAAFKIGSLNVSSFSRLERRIEISRHLYQNNYDFLCVQETRLKVEQNCVDRHYVFFRNDEGVGLLIAAKKKFKCEQLIIKNLSKITTSCIAIKGKGALLVISIYVPCGIREDDLIADLDTINSFISGRNCIVGGDFNTNSTRTNSFIKWLATVNHELRVITPSLPTFRTGSTLDHFVVSTSLFGGGICRVTDVGMEHKLIAVEVGLKYFAENLDEEDDIIKWQWARWSLFKENAIINNNTFVPGTRNISNGEIDDIINSFTEDVQRSVAQSVPVGKRGRNCF